MSTSASVLLYAREHERCTSTVINAFTQPLVDLYLNNTEQRLTKPGKYLLVHLSDARVLHSHMDMTGRWHVWRHHQYTGNSLQHASLLLCTCEHRAVCFALKVLELLTPSELNIPPFARAHGRDLLATGFEERSAVARLRRHVAAHINAAIMNQSCLSGIGNIYKSEVLFLCCVNPLATVGALTD